jgi:hypothetical protein
MNAPARVGIHYRRSITIATGWLPLLATAWIPQPYAIAFWVSATSRLLAAVRT